ncbi:MAG: hypothetical protein NTY19_07220 [Planctomycetota bacterium]|nr:hypothetical protein [Planctomycetota bacterium]
MPDDTDRRDHPEVQQGATASDAHASKGPDTVGNDRRTKAQAALRGAAVHAGVIARYLWAEFRAIAVATALQSWRLIQHGIALARLRLLTADRDAAHRNLGAAMYRRGVGGTTVREAIGELDEQIDKQTAAKQSVSRLIRDRGRLLIRLSEAPLPDGDSLDGPERDRALACQQDVERQRGRVEATRASLRLRDTAETKHVVMGFVAILMAVTFAGFGIFSVAVVGEVVLARGHKSRVGVTTVDAVAPVQAERTSGLWNRPNTSDSSGPSPTPIAQQALAPAPEAPVMSPGFWDKDQAAAAPVKLPQPKYDRPGPQRSQATPLPSSRERTGGNQASSDESRPGLHRAGYSENDCLICRNGRSLQARGLHSDKREFGFCDSCGRAYQGWTRFLQNSQAGLPSSFADQQSAEQFKAIMSAHFHSYDDEGRRGMGVIFLLGKFASSEWHALTGAN